MSQNKMLAKLQSIFGLETVEKAIKNQDSIIPWQLTNVYNRLMVMEAQRELDAKMNSLQEAVSFASRLDPTVRLCVILGVLAASERPVWNLVYSQDK